MCVTVGVGQHNSLREYAVPLLNAIGNMEPVQ